MEQLDSSYFHGVSAPLSPAVISLIESAAAALDVDRAASRKYLLRASALLRTRIIRTADDRRRSGLAAWQIERVTTYVDDKLSDPIKTEDLAELVHLSLSHFFRSFKTSIGIPPAEYIRRRRLDFAQRLMQTTDRPLIQIALDCGMSDQAQLCRVFRRHLGQSPNGWRRLHAVAPESRMSAINLLASDETIQLPSTSQKGCAASADSHQR
jgi:AraC family transcriptional regulator